MEDEDLFIYLGKYLANSVNVQLLFLLLAWWYIEPVHDVLNLFEEAQKKTFAFSLICQY